MKRELWLEFGFVKDGFHDMCWYNEARWQELPYFLWHWVKWLPKHNVYFKWSFGRNIHFLRGRQAND